MWKPNTADEPAFPINGVMVLGSDFGDAVSYDAQFERDVAYRSEIDGATWRGLLKLVDLAGIQRDEIFCTNAWPCLRVGDEPVKGGIPGSRDGAFTARCLEFLRLTLDLMRPRLVLTLGLAPTAFIARLFPDDLAPWVNAKCWRDVDRMPIAAGDDIAFVPVVHPSMPNRRHRVSTKTIEGEAALVRRALAMRSA